MKIAVIDYGSGNIASASRGLALAAERGGVAAEVVVTSDPEEVARADRLVLPGQGAFADCARGLRTIAGLWEAIARSADAGRPFLTPGFGWIAGEIAPLDVPGLRLPHMGWNALDFRPGAHELLDGLVPGDHAYFVHSYALAGGRQDQVLAGTDYGGPVVAMVVAGNRAGTQFHVEKSQEVGLRILLNFLRWSP